MVHLGSGSLHEEFQQGLTVSETIWRAEEHQEISVVGPGGRVGFGVLGIQSPFQGSSSLGKSCTAFFVGSDVLWLSCRAQSYAERLRLGLAVIHGEAQCTEQDMDDGRHSPPMVKNATVHPGLELPCKIKLLCSSLSKKDEWEMAPGGAL